MQLSDDTYHNRLATVVALNINQNFVNGPYLQENRAWNF